MKMRIFYLNFLIFYFLSNTFFVIAKDQPIESNDVRASRDAFSSILEGTTDVTKITKKRIYLSHFIDRAVLISSKKEKPDVRLVVLILVHGTWAKGSPEFIKDSDPTYQNAKNFSYKLSVKHKRPVLMISFGWSGMDNEERRKAAGAGLASLLKEFKNEHLIAGIAHSHGGNVFHYASHFIERPVDLLIDMGVPPRGVGAATSEERYYRPEKIRKLVNIYSSADPIQVAGSVVRGQVYTSLTSSDPGRIQPYQHGKRIINVNLKINGRSPGHVVIKDMLGGLFQLLEHIEKHYKIHDNFAANITYTKGRQPIETVVIGDFLTTKDLVLREHVGELNWTNPEVSAQIRKEVQHSRDQELQFNRLHPRFGNIRSKRSIAGRFIPTIRDIMRIIYMSIIGRIQQFKGKAEDAFKFIIKEKG